MVRLGKFLCWRRGCAASTNTEQDFFFCNKCDLTVCREHLADLVGRECCCGRGGELREMPAVTRQFDWSTLLRPEVIVTATRSSPPSKDAPKLRPVTTSAPRRRA